MSLLITSIQAIEWTTRFTAVYILIDTSEKLYYYKEFKGEGFFSWKIISKNLFFTSLPELIGTVLNIIFDFRMWLSLLALRGISGFLLLFLPQQGLTTTLSLLSVFVVGSLMNFRNTPFGAETENRLALMITGALLLRSVAPSEFITSVCLWFMTLQSCLSYITAGVTKLLTPEWRNGNGILQVINSPNLIPLGKAYVFFNQYRFFGKFLTWLTIGIECVFPCVLFVGRPFFWLFLIWGVFFHLLIAIWLRFGKFFWVWIATYPAIVFIAQWQF